MEHRVSWSKSPGQRGNQTNITVETVIQRRGAFCTFLWQTKHKKKQSLSNCSFRIWPGSDFLQLPWSRDTICVCVNIKKLALASYTSSAGIVPGSKNKTKAWRVFTVFGGQQCFWGPSSHPSCPVTSLQPKWVWTQRWWLQDLRHRSEGRTEGGGERRMAVCPGWGWGWWWRGVG